MHISACLAARVCFPFQGRGWFSKELELGLTAPRPACLSSLGYPDTPVPLPLRLLKDGLKDSQFSMRYQYLLAALLCCCGKGLREEFNRQCWLVNTLAKLAQQVREAAPSARQVSGVRLPLPVSSSGLLQPVINLSKQKFPGQGSNWCHSCHQSPSDQCWTLNLLRGQKLPLKHPDQQDGT